MNKIKIIKEPFTEEKFANIKAGDEVLLSGKIIGARDEAHKRLEEAIIKNGTIPFELKDCIIFYVGPSPARPGAASGAVGPTTSARMDRYMEPLLKKGLRAVIGKGDRSQKTRNLMKDYKAVYFTAPGGISALLASKIKSIKPIAYDDLGPEAVFEIIVEKFPLFAAYDIYGRSIFELARLAE